MAEQMVGSWVVDPKKGGLPQKLATGFSQAMEGLTGAGYEPLLYCGLQLVNGINHMIICKQTKVTNPPVVGIAEVVLNEKLIDEVNSKFELVTIEEIASSGPTLGGWAIDPKTEFPDEFKSKEFEKVFEELIGAKYEPLLYCGSQVVSGTNYMFFYKQTLITNPKVIHLVKVVIHKTLQGEYILSLIDVIV
jgi:hypothetical protein